VPIIVFFKKLERENCEPFDSRIAILMTMKLPHSHATLQAPVERSVWIIFRLAGARGDSGAYRLQPNGEYFAADFMQIQQRAATGSIQQQRRIPSAGPHRIGFPVGKEPHSHHIDGERGRGGIACRQPPGNS
jgi:hypothetical protein